jgi:diguanylate cyclase (GGDEF)-like protein
MAHHSRGRRDTEGLWDWNLESDRIHYSPQWIALAGCDDHQVGNTPQEWFQRVHPHDRQQLSHDIGTARADASEFELRYRLRHENGTYRWMCCRGVIIRNETGDAIRMTGTQTDVTVETVTDPVTGLPNRLLLVDRLNRSIHRARRYDAFHFALLVLNLDGPRAVRADRGYFSEDVLTAAARRLETSLRVPDTPPSLRHNDFVSRLENDQFAVLLDGLKDVSHVKVVADRLLREILAPLSLGGHEIRLTASVGIAVSGTGYSDADEVLRDAQTAVHRAQVLGGSHAEIFDTAILKSERTELRLEADFEGALERGEFRLFYQPIVSLESNRVVGFEALLRWNHPILGAISPVDFVPLAERTGLIVPLGEWILREACRQLSGWQNSIPHASDLWVSVNLSGVQLQHAALVDEVTEALRGSSLKPQSLVLELTEGVAMANPTAVKTLLMRLRAMGVRISLDDFGTGYSSLAHLRQFPVDTLKVDRAFVRGIESHKESADIVGSVTAMAQQLGLSVVAEGIENDEQARLLRSLRCESGQGNLFAKPLDVNGASDLLKTGLAPRRDRMPTHLASSHAWVARLTRARDTAGHFPIPRRVRVAAALLLAASAGVLLAAWFHATPEFTSAQPGLIANRPLPPEPVAGVVQTTATPSPEPAAPESASLKVLHLHRLGHCQGRLIVARNAVTFAPDEKTGSDVFAFQYGEFLHSVDVDTLTIRSHTRTYRFKASPGIDPTKTGRTLADIGAMIARFRRDQALN